jgi:hypothetical protein
MLCFLWAWCVILCDLCCLCVVSYCSTTVALIRERNIPTEWQSLVGEVSANFCGQSDNNKKYNIIYFNFCSRSMVRSDLKINQVTSWSTELMRPYFCLPAANVECNWFQYQHQAAIMTQTLSIVDCVHPHYRSSTSGHTATVSSVIDRLTMASLASTVCFKKSFTTLKTYKNLFGGYIRFLNSLNVAKLTELRFNVTSPGNAGCSKKIALKW